jgi:hypothetical protein
MLQKILHPSIYQGENRVKCGAGAKPIHQKCRKQHTKTCEKYVYSTHDER